MITRWTARLAVILIVAVTQVPLLPIDGATKAQPPAALTVDLSGERQTVSGEFDQRIKASFPIGSAVSAMGVTLQNQGFFRQDWSSSVEREHVAMRREDSFSCNRSAYIYWHDDGADQLTSIRGAYRDEGCL